MTDDIESRLAAAHREARRSVWIFRFLVFLFFLLIALIIFGLYWDRREVIGSLQPHGQFLEGLIANGLSVILSVLLITPLTFYFINYRREKELKPIRIYFIDNLASSIERLADDHIRFLGLHYIGIELLLSITTVDALGSLMEDASINLGAITEKLQNLDTPLPKRSRTAEEKSTISENLILKAELIKNLAQRHYEGIYKDVQDIENILVFSVQQFPIDGINSLHQIRTVLMKYRENLKFLIDVLEGIKDPGVILRAKYTALNFNDLIENLNIICRTCSIDESRLSFNSAAELAKPIQLIKQRNFSEKLVDLFEQVRKIDEERESRKK